MTDAERLRDFAGFAARFGLPEDAEACLAGAAALEAQAQPAEARSCGATHAHTGAVCELPPGHISENHRGPFTHGIAQWPAEDRSTPEETPAR